MYNKTIFLASAAGLSIISAGPVQAQDPALTEIIVVGQSNQIATTATQVAIDPGSRPNPAPDAANVVARAPGASVNANGPLSGQVQYHGVYGDRVLTLVNGQRFGSGGPNLMDPPLHYAPAVLLDTIELDRSVSPVRRGPGLGGGVNAILKAPTFALSDALTPQMDASAMYRSADTSYAVGAMAGLASKSVRIGVIGAFEKGDDHDFPGGTVASTRFERLTFGIQAGAKAGDGEMAISYRRQETNPSGNAPFPMDIIYFNTDFLQFSYVGQVSDSMGLEFHAGHVAVRHLMDNNSVRLPPADMTKYRATKAAADSFTADAALRIGAQDRHVRIGLDYESGTKDVRITNPKNADFFLKALNGARAFRWGGFAEWRGAIGPVEAELGARFDRYTARAGVADLGAAVPLMPRLLASSFAASDRRWSDTGFDLVARFWAETGAITPRLTLARKTRAPGAVERFSWLPTEASGGLADGNIYVGDSRLKMEAAWIAEVGADWATAGFYARPTLYYRRINNYVQGVAYDATPGVVDSPVEMVASMNGDATPLRFANVDAEIYGADMGFGAKLAGPLRLDGVVSYVRGKRRDISDNLYRIAPPNARLSLGWLGTGWNASVEAIGFARQNTVSQTNSEDATGGYIVANAFGGASLADGIRLDVGVENIFDRYFEEHLGGYNRVAGSDVPIGARLPGAGRSFFARIALRY